MQNKNNYKILETIDLGSFLTRPSGDMMRTLRPLKRDVYESSQRIAFYIKGEIPWDLLAHLQRVVNILDISNCFILLYNDCASTYDLIKKVRDRYATGDETLFELEITNDIPISNSHGTAKPILNPSEFMCVLPWRRLEIKPWGDTRTCCTISTPIKLTDNGPVYNINSDPDFSWEKLYFSHSMKDLRERFRRGEKPKECVRCWVEEDNGHPSHRTGSGILADGVTSTFEMNYEEENFNNLEELDIKPGNLCNLSCRICSGNLSSTFAAEELQSVPKEKVHQHPIYINNQRSNWPLHRNDFWNDTAKIQDQIKHIWLSGGETFMVPNLSTVFEQIQNPKDTTITINTNGTILPKNYFSLWKKYKLINLMVSIDDITDRFEYQRNKAQWKDLLENINTIKQHRSSNVSTSLMCTVNAQNVLYLPELYEWAKDQPFDNLCFNPYLHFPMWARLDRITQHAKDLIIAKLSNHNFGQYQSRIDTILNEIKNVQPTDGTEFCTNTRYLDNLRNQDFSKAHPEMAEAMGYKKYE